MDVTTHLGTTKPAPKTHQLQPRARLVAELLSTKIVQLPPWFSAGAALRVTRLKNVRHILVLDRGRLVGSISDRTLRLVPAADPLARWMSNSTAFVSPGTTADSARELMAREEVDCLPVLGDSVLVGLINREDLDRGDVTVDQAI